MALSQKLEFRQSQALVMTPQLMQAIKLLQLSNLDLVAYVDAELERNPLLERANDEPEAPAAVNGKDHEPTLFDGGAFDAAPPEGPDAPRPETEIRAGDWLDGNLSPSRADIEGRLDTDLENVFPDEAAAAPAKAAAGEALGYSEWASVGGGGREDDDYNLEAFVSAELTLSDHLIEQVSLSFTDPALRLIAIELVDLVDDAGWITGDIAAVADRLGCSLVTVEEVLKVLQRFDPPGVCARNLAECLALQLAERDRLDPAMKALIDHLDLLAKRDFHGLKKLCGVDDEDLADMVAEVRRLNPKPGLAYGRTVVQPIVPDVFVRPGPDGDWMVELNSDTLPKVLVNQTYYTQVSRTAKNDADKAFLSECLQTATWLTRSLDQRARTILKVATEIVRQQDAFLAHGVQYLRPLNLRNVADAIGMHESTVSRVTANKYMATNRGIFEMKYFFTSAIQAADGGEAHSAEAVRHRIKQLIDLETPADVLSDDTIVDKLREQGIDIARRTVAKYREAMRIPSSVQRRREKQALAAHG